METRRSPHRHPRTGRWLPLLILVTAAAAACSPATSPPPVHRGPIVLITLEGLRFDEVGALGGVGGATPNLDHLVGEADWAGAGVASSSWLVPSMASISTGLGPWRHQAIYPLHARLAEPLFTLAEALKRLGYRTAAYVSNAWLSPRQGYDQGFTSFYGYGRGKRAQGHLRSLEDDRTFLWIHIGEPRAPYQRRDWLLPPQDAAGLPERVETAQLEPYFDPRVPVPAALAARFRRVYRYDVAWADEQLRRLLDALRESGRWDRTLLVVTASHGQDFGEQGQVLDGGNLGRRLLEVPLVIKLPAGFPRKLAVPPSRRVATDRLWATLVEAAGGQVAPAVAPSLFEPLSPPILSELYLADGTNRFSLLDGDLQLLWTTRFAPDDDSYYRARLIQAGGARGRPGEPSPGAVFRRLRRTFLDTLPLSGDDSAPRLRLVRWVPGGTEPVSDPRLAEHLRGELRSAWYRFLDEERTPAEEARRWSSRKTGRR